MDFNVRPVPGKPGGGFIYWLRNHFLTSEPGSRFTKKDWIGVAYLGKGGQGHAGLWVKLDEHEKIVQHMVIKETFLSALYYEESQWHKKGYPQEAYTNRLAQCLNDSIVQLYAFKDYSENLSYRLYMEYCALGDLDNVLQPYKTSEKHVPEPFVWKLFEDLASAAVNLENLVNPPEEDSYIVHMDLKPPNIFLQPPDKDRFPKYPVAKIGDFGCAVVSDPNDGDNRNKILEAGFTPGYLPSEVHQIKYKARSKLGSKEKYHVPMLQPVNGAANIWTIAVIIAEVMTKRHPRPKQSGLDTRNAWLNKNVCGRRWRELKYSKDLKRIVKSCLKPLPAHRPSAEKLLAKIQQRKMAHIGVMGGKKCLDESYNGEFDLLEEVELTSKFFVGCPKPEIPSVPPDWIAAGGLPAKKRSEIAETTAVAGDDAEDSDDSDDFSDFGDAAAGVGSVPGAHPTTHSVREGAVNESEFREATYEEMRDKAATEQDLGITGRLLELKRHEGAKRITDARKHAEPKRIVAGAPPGPTGIKGFFSTKKFFG